MTEAQNQTREKAKQILSEHFEVYLLSVMEDVTDNTTRAHHCYDGGWYAAVGLAEHFKMTQMVDMVQARKD